jgi:hypothetical protein
MGSKRGPKGCSLTESQYLVLKLIQEMIRKDEDTYETAIHREAVAAKLYKPSSRFFFQVMKKLRKKGYLGQVDMVMPLRTTGYKVKAHYVTNAGEKAMEEVAALYEKKK